MPRPFGKPWAAALDGIVPQPPEARLKLSGVPRVVGVFVTGWFCYHPPALPFQKNELMNPTQEGLDLSARI